MDQEVANIKGRENVTVFISQKKEVIGDDIKGCRETQKINDSWV